MQKRLFQLLALAASLSGTGVAIALFAPGTADPATPAPAATAHAPAPTVLPTIHVHADATLPLLPVVTVRPEPAPIEPRAVLAAHPAISADQALALLATGTTTGTSFDMPYYSFGQTQRRVSKE